MLHQVHELLQPSLCVFDQQTPAVGELGGFWVEDVGGEDCPQVDDDLLGAGHEALA